MKNILLLSMLILSQFVDAQWISGKILCEDGNPAIGATVIVKGTQRGTITDINGDYQIEVDTLHTTLSFEFLGYKRQEIDSKNDSVINVTLAEEDILLDELLVLAKVHLEKTLQFKTDTIRIKKFRIHKFKIHRFTEHIRVYPIEENNGECKLSWNENYWNQYLKKLDAFKYIFDNVNYPELSACHGIEGKVIVRFTIDLEGNIKNIKLLVGLDELIDEKVLSVFLSAPKLTNHEIKQLGIYKSTYFVLPIKFKLQN